MCPFELNHQPCTISTSRGPFLNSKVFEQWGTEFVSLVIQMYILLDEYHAFGLVGLRDLTRRAGA